MRQLLIKQSTIVRNGSRREVSWLLCILPFDFIRLFRLLLVRSLALAAHNWGVRKLYENMYLCQAIAKSPGEWHQDFILSSFWPLHKKHTKSEHCKSRDKATVSKLMQQIFILAFFWFFFRHWDIVRILYFCEMAHKGSALLYIQGYQQFFRCFWPSLIQSPRLWFTLTVFAEGNTTPKPFLRRKTASMTFIFFYCQSYFSPNDLPIQPLVFMISHQKIAMLLLYAGIFIRIQANEFYLAYCFDSFPCMFLMQSHKNRKSN